MLIAVLAVLAGPAGAGARYLPGDAFLCHDARPVRGARGGVPVATFHPRVGVSVIDRFTRPVPSERYTWDLKKAQAYCRPVRIDGEEVGNPLSGLEAYAARPTRRRPAPPPVPAASETIDTSFGTVTLRIGGVAALRVPTLATGSVGGGTGPDRDHLACYDVRPERGSEPRRGVLRVDVRTAEGRHTIEVRKPMQLCVPASVRGEDTGAPKRPVDLLCFDARLARGETDAAAKSDVATRNGFGNELLKLGNARVLCVPAARSDVVVPTPTPFPTLTPLPTETATPTPVPTPRVPTLRIAPATTTGLVRDRSCVAALLELPDGSTTDVTATANWRIADGAIAAPSGFEDGRKCFVGLTLGATDLTARDATLGLASPPARLHYEWPIFKLEVAPKHIGLRPGEAATVTATASFTGGRTRNVTQLVEYVSDDEDVARAPNAAGNRSRVEAVRDGIATVIAHDPLSSLFDSFVVSVGALEGVRIEPIPLVFPGDHVHLQATGLFGGGFQSNFTQDVTYESSDPAVVAAPNDPADRNRIDVLQPGVATITAVHAATGIRSTCCGRVSVLGNAIDVVVQPTVASYRKGVGGDALDFRAVGLFAIPPVDRAYAPATERLTWSFTLPGVVALGELVDGRQRFTPVGGGVAQLHATDPASGAYGTALVTVYDRLDRLDVATSRDVASDADERTIVVGDGARYYAHGWFDGSRYRRVDEVRFAASPPDLVRFEGNLARGLRVGTATISAVDEPSGLSSTATGGRNLILHVVGGVERLVLSPATATLTVGETRTLTAVAYREGGGPGENYTQQVSYRSSDPSVVIATNDWASKSRIVAVGPGTARISAVEPASGIDSSTTGDDTVVTVTDATVVRLVVTPATRRMAVGSSARFVATGVFADGTSRNLTQHVEWRSSDAATAAAPNAAGDRSRVDALAPGTVTIAAFEPDAAIVSTDTGDDATVTVAALAALTLSPAAVELRVGESFSLTTVGVVDGAASINVTQEAVYASSDPAIVAAPNDAGNKSRVTALAPGVATVTASRPSSYPQATASNAITVTVLPAP